MPCRSDYMDPNHREIEVSKVLSCLDELNTGIMTTVHYDGCHPKAYMKCVTLGELNGMTDRLCNKLSQLKKTDLTTKSLELQLWWRDHLEGEERRTREDGKINMR